MTDLDDQHEDLRKPRGGTDGGGSVVFADPRVSRGINILVGILSITIVAIGTWVATSINGLTIAVTKAAERIEFVASTQRISDARNDVRNDNQDTRLGRVEQDVAAIRGVNHRGAANGK